MSAASDRRRARRAVVVASLLVASLAGAGCHTSPAPTVYRNAIGPEGGQVAVTTATRRVEGELLAVSDTAIILRVREEITLVPLALARRVDVGYVTESWHAEPVDQGARERMRVAARFPQGIDDALLRELLEHAGQAAPVVVSERP